MSGKHAGLQAILREKYMPRGIYIHCSTHRLNLVIVGVCKVVPYVDEFFSIMSKLHNYFSSSGVTSECFRNAQQSLSIGMKCAIIEILFGEIMLLSFRHFKS